MSNFISNLYSYLDDCPIMSVEGEHSKIYVNFTTKKPRAFDLEVLPQLSRVRKYVDGGGLVQRNFVLRLVERYEGRDVSLNIEIIELFERMSVWFDENPPDIDGWVKVEAVTSGRLENVDNSNTAIFQMQCRVIYAE